MLSCGCHFDEDGPPDPDDWDEDWAEWEDELRSRA